MTLSLGSVSAPAPTTRELEGDTLLPSPRQTNEAMAQRRYLDAPAPWRSRDAGRALLLSTVGVIGLGCCWFGAGGELSLRDQVPWLLGALLTTAVLVFTGVSWLITGMREVRQGMRQLALDKQMVFGLPDPAALAGSRLAGPAFEVEDRQPQADAADQLYAGPGMHRAHRADCPLLRGKAVTRLPAGSAAEPCGVCLP